MGDNILNVIKNNIIMIVFYLFLGLFSLVLNFFDHFNLLNKTHIIVMNVFIWIFIIYLLSGIYYHFYAQMYLKNINKFINNCNRYFCKLFKTNLILGITKILFLIPFILSIIFYNASNIFPSNVVRIISFSVYSLLTVFAIAFIYTKGISGINAVLLSVKYIAKHTRKTGPIFLIITFKLIINIVLLYISIKIDSYTYIYWIYSGIRYLCNNFFDLLLFIFSLKIINDVDHLVKSNSNNCP